MKYRKLDPDGDYLFGRSSVDFIQNTPETVAQAVVTRLRLYLGEWFLDVNEGTPWNTKVLGRNTAGTRDVVLQERILGTQGLTEITQWRSVLNPDTRVFDVTTTVSTIYGETTITGPM